MPDISSSTSQAHRLHDHNHTYSLASLTGQGSPSSKHFCWLRTGDSAKNGVPTKAEERFLHPFVREMAQSVSTKAFYSQPGQPPCARLHSIATIFMVM